MTSQLGSARFENDSVGGFGRRGGVSAAAAVGAVSQRGNCQVPNNWPGVLGFQSQLTSAHGLPSVCKHIPSFALFGYVLVADT